ncbi:unnamed protein product [Alopecurus aequalis]
MGRLVLITPRCCIPIASRDHDENLLCRGMEEGVDVRQQPPPTQLNPVAWRRFKIFFRCLTTTLGVGMVVFAFVGRHYNLLPELQDPSEVALIMFMALIQVGIGFMIGDLETNSVTAHEEQHL